MLKSATARASAALVAGLFAVNQSFAVDVTAAIADVEQASDDIESIGLALLGATLVVVTIGFIRRAMSRV